MPLGDARFKQRCINNGFALDAVNEISTERKATIRRIFTLTMVSDVDVSEQFTY